MRCASWALLHQGTGIAPDTPAGDLHQPHLVLSLAATYHELITPMIRQPGDTRTLTTRMNRLRLEFSPTNLDGHKMGVTTVLTTQGHSVNPGTLADADPGTLMANGHTLTLVLQGHILDQ